MSCLSSINKWTLPELSRTYCHVDIHLNAAIDALQKTDIKHNSLNQYINICII